VYVIYTDCRVSGYFGKWKMLNILNFSNAQHTIIKAFGEWQRERESEMKSKHRMNECNGSIGRRSDYDGSIEVSLRTIIINLNICIFM